MTTVAIHCDFNKTEGYYRMHNLSKPNMKGQFIFLIKHVSLYSELLISTSDICWNGHRSVYAQVGFKCYRNVFTKKNKNSLQVFAFNTEELEREG